jgi:hypothetical protein
MQGCHLSLPGSYTIICRTRGLSLLSWIRRSSILPRSRHVDVGIPHARSSCNISNLWLMNTGRVGTLDKN